MSEPRFTGFDIPLDASNTPQIGEASLEIKRSSSARVSTASPHASSRFVSTHAAPSQSLPYDERSDLSQMFSIGLTEGTLHTDPDHSTTEIKAVDTEPPARSTAHDSTHDHSAHDHSAHDHSAHDHSAQDHSAKYNSQEHETREIQESADDNEVSETVIKIAQNTRRILRFALLGVIIIFYLAYDALTTLEPFQVRSVTIQGAHHVSKDELINSLHFEVLRPSYLTPKLHSIVNTIETHPWIREATATFDLFSGEIEIIIREHKPYGVVALDELKVVTAEGIPFAAVQPQEIKGLPLISGVSAESFQRSPHDALVGQYWIARAIELARHIQASELLRNHSLSDIHISETGLFEVMLDHIRVVLGSDMLHERILELERILEHLNHKGVSAAYILLSADLKRAIVKEIPLQARGNHAL